eukprot:jgi/Mesen1/2417/ME000157S01555
MARSFRTDWHRLCCWQELSMPRCSAATLLVVVAFLVTGACEGKSVNDERVTASMHSVRARELFQLWTRVYGLESNSTMPPDKIVFPKPEAGGGAAQAYVPPAPHLEACAAKAGESAYWEKRGPKGEAPTWTGPSEDGGPHPPWVRGGDADNLAMTRVVQADVWAHQFPANCTAEGTRFVLAEWLPTTGHGLGSQLHVMTAALSLAMAYGRILVPFPGTFMRALHPDCTGDAHGSLSCYFAAVTSRQCQEHAMRLWGVDHGVNYNFKNVWPVLASRRPVVLCSYWQVKLRWQSDIAKKWGTPWLKRQVSIENMGTIPTQTDRDLRVRWWRSQGVRFLLRWPSRYMCHITNRVRHEAYGLQAALQVASAEWAQHLIVERERAELPQEGEVLAGVDLGGGHSLQDTAWRGQEPYIMRPIVSLHVRQGDKAREMRLFSLAAHMWLAERLRMHAPDVRHVWLSTEMQSVVERTADYRDWTFWYTRVKRQEGNTSLAAYENEVGLAELTGKSLANLVVSAECDFFVGTLGSNWNRLINELRLTNGRLHSGYISSNYGDW